ncbi:uncharacterized protein LTR77_006697 [Saxophila tyrrhenica]|uniref:alpha-amylase n=1 Tax=Saxophila tyrrhenica TaxID=1690608 RepID=A0AAV9P699_9PEZI|nr:hypothetical protein LTR77_006697 [Saxophila tyrrhenica]
MYKSLQNTFLGLALLTSSALAATSDQWRGRSIYQVMTDRFAVDDGSTTEECDTSMGTYCGGTFNGIRQRLDYIQDMGFDAIWISPVTKQVDGDEPGQAGYHGYWQQDLYAIEPHFGTADDLKALSAELHDRGMYLMVDVVVNHFAWKGDVDSIEYSKLSPFNDESNYHNYCEINFDDFSDWDQIEQCWLPSGQVPLPDLRTEDADVAAGYNTWISELVSNYSIDGLRLDTVMEVDRSFWADFVQAADVYMVGEVAFGDPGTVCSYQDHLPGMLDYGTFFDLTTAFKSPSNSMSDLADSISSVQDKCADSTLLGTFSENHDQPRFPYLNPDLAAAKNLIAHTLLSDGIPILYEGQEQHFSASGSDNGGNDPYNREAVWTSGYDTDAELYQLVTKLNAARSAAIADNVARPYLHYQSETLYADDSTLATRKGKMVTVLTNCGSEGDSYTVEFDAKYQPNKKLTEVLTCETAQADGEGKIEVEVTKGEPKVYYPTERLGGSGVCGN